MLPQIRELANRIIRDCENQNALDVEDVTYLKQIKTSVDLMNYRHCDKMHNLAMDAAKALGMSTEWIAQKDAEFYGASVQDESSRDFSHSGLGIGGLSGHIEEVPVLTIAQIERMERIERKMMVCRRCGSSDLLDGAMFTTCPSSGLCDDCF